jgi:hypothetical protein
MVPASETEPSPATIPLSAGTSITAPYTATAATAPAAGEALEEESFVSNLIGGTHLGDTLTLGSSDDAPSSDKPLYFVESSLDSESNRATRVKRS